MLRVTITTPRPIFDEPGIEDIYNAAVNDEIVKAARATGQSIVMLEVAYPGDDLLVPEGDGTTTVWDRSGDALEVDLTVDPPTLRSLSSARWAANR